MQRYASFRILAARIARAGDRPLRVTGHRHTFAYEPQPGYLYVRSRAISSRANDNHDEFPAIEIKKAYRTFIGKPVFVNHHNDDPRRARGVIVDAALHEDLNPDGSPDTWVEVLMQVDAHRFPRLAKAILAGDVARTSMGTNVEYSVCSFCGNKAETPIQYCRHIAAMKGRRITRTTAAGTKEAVLVTERCYGLSFFENSLLVEPPADPTAHVVGVDDRGLKMTAGRKVAVAQNLPKHQYKVTLPDGRVHTMNSTRDYSHALVSKREGGDWGVWSFAGSEEKAHRVRRTEENAYARNKAQAPEFRVVPVDNPRPRTAGRRLAYGEQVAPPKVDTLRPEDCPICGDRDTFDGAACQVCGYIAPPDQFQDPDLEMAGEADLRQSEEEQPEDPDEDPEDEQDDDEEDEPPDDDDDDDESEEDDPERRKGVVGMTTKQQANAARTQRNQLLAAVRGQQERLDAMEGRLAEVSGALAFVADVAGLSAHPKVAAALSGSAQAAQPKRSAAYHQGLRQGALDRRQQTDITVQAKVAEWDGADPEWRDGWTAGYEEEQQRIAARKTAGEDEEREPVATTSEQALQPDARDNPESYGTAPAPANAEVTPDATTDPQSPTVAIPAEPYNQLVDVTEQNDLVPPPPGPASHVQQDITSQPVANDLAPAFPVDGWATRPPGATASKLDDTQARFFASLRLARLRRQAGISDQDELVLHHAIASSPATMEVIAAETTTLEAVLKRTASSPQRVEAARGLVPRAAVPATRAPSLASGSGERTAVQASMSTGVAGAEEFLDL